MRVLVLLVVMTACKPAVTSGRCDDGRLCENADWCVAGGGCVRPEPDCIDQPDGVPCALGEEIGRCVSGTTCEAIPASCGDHAIDDDEECDGVEPSCTSLGYSYGGAVTCQSCLVDATACRVFGWRAAPPLPGTPQPQALWADGGEVWIGTDTGMYRLVADGWQLVEARRWIGVARARTGEMLGLRDDGVLVRFGDTRTEWPPIDVAMTMKVLDSGEVLVAALSRVVRIRLDEPTWTSEAVPGGGFVFALHEIDGVTYAGGIPQSAMGLWRHDGTGWVPVPLPQYLTIRALAGRAGALDIATNDGSTYRWNGQALVRRSVVGNRFGAMGDGRLTYSAGNGTAVYEDAVERAAVLTMPAPIATSWDPVQQRLWASTSIGVFVHDGSEVTKVSDLAFSELMLVGDDLSLAADTPSGSVVAWWRANGLSAAPTIGGDAISYATGPTIEGMWTQDENRYYLIRGGSLDAYDLTTGLLIPTSMRLPARAVAGNGETVMAVGAGAWLYDPAGGRWTAATSGLPVGIELHAIAPLGSGFVAAGTTGALVVFADGMWSQWTTATEQDLAAVHAIGDVILAVGRAGTIVRCTAGTCTAMATTITADLTDIAGNVLDDVFAVGGGATLHFDGTRWSELAIGAAPSRVAIGAGVVWFAGRGPGGGLHRLLRVGGGSW